MHKSDGPLQRESQDAHQQKGSLDGYATDDAGHGGEVGTRHSLWRRLLNWLINIFPLLLSGVSAFIVLYLLAKLFRLR
jgi:hypothetical protein